MNRIARLTLVCMLCAAPALAQGQVTPEPASQTETSKPSYKIVGYYPQWGIDSTPAYNVKSVITSGSAPLLTHLIYAFANIVDNKCASYDPAEDYEYVLPASQTVNGKADVKGAFAGNFHQLKELKALYPRLEILISIGGGAMNPAIFSKAAEPANRKAFVASCVDMYIKGQFANGMSEPGIFTGIDLDWEFPASAADRTNYIALLEEFHKQITWVRSDYVLTSTAGASSYQWSYADLNAAQKYVNFFNAMMYDFDGPWSNETGFVAPLYQAKLDPDPTNNADYAIQKYVEMGVDRRKIVFGMPFYAYHWTEVPSPDHGLFQNGVADQNGYQYNNIVSLKGPVKYRDVTTREPWLYSETRKSFWTYDDPVSLEFKTKYVVGQGLGGVMFWELSGDTKDGTLIKALARSL